MFKSQCLAKTDAIECRGCGECKSVRSEAGGVRHSSAGGECDSDEHVGVYRRQFDRSPSLAREFGDVKAYVTFRRAEAHGLVQIFRRESATVLGATH